MKSRWLLPVLLACVFSCDPRDTEPALDLESGTVTGRVRIFLIAPEGTDAADTEGRKVGCGDSAVPVVVDLPRKAPALAGALQALLDLHESRHAASGLLNPLYASRLSLAGIDRRGAEARIRLTGYLEIVDGCDASRVLAQITETALQFPDVQRVQVFLEGKPLRDLLPAGS